MTTPDRPDAGPILGERPVVAVLRARHASEYAPVVEALATGGVPGIELTLSTAGVFDEMPGLIGRVGDAAAIGVGTITTVSEATAAIEHGARFLVTPTTDVEIVRTAVAAGVPIFPGGLTPTELFAGWAAGASAVKLFPASTVGPGYLGQLRGPFPDLQVVPSGGVGIEDAPAWIDAGAAAVSLGGPLLQDAFTGGDLTDLTTRAAHLTALVGDAVARRRERS